MQATIRFAFLLIAIIPLSIIGQIQGPVPGAPNEKPNFDALADAPVVSTLALGALAATATPAFAAPGMPFHVEPRLGVPTFFWALPASAPAGATLQTAGGPSREESAARAHLSRHAAEYRLDATDVKDAVMSSIHNTGTGPVIVTFHQNVDGIEIFRDEVKISMKQNLELIAISGYIIGRASTGTVNRSFPLSRSQALAKVVSDLLDSTVDAQQFSVSGNQNPYQLFQVAPSANAAPANFRFLQAARVKQVYYRLPSSLEPAYYVDVEVLRTGDAEPLSYSYVIAATDGRLLFRNNQTQKDAFSYRVWADTTGLKAPFVNAYGNSVDPKDPPSVDPPLTFPPYVSTNLVTLQNGPISTNDPWLPPNATTTVGNNVEAFADLSSPDGFTANSNDIYASTTSSKTFDRAYDPMLGPQSSTNQIQAAITQLFYNINFFHDWYYDAGFKEVDGNAQLSNYSRGGIENDSIFAEAQDFASRNNANMSTPADGGRPRMRMYIWNGPAAHTLTLIEDGTGSSYNHGTATFGAQNFNIDAPLTLTNPTNACSTISPIPNIAGKVAFVNRGGCDFDVKVKNAQDAGAVGVIVGNISTSSNPTVPASMGPGTPTPQTGITIGALSVNLADANYIRQQLTNGFDIEAVLFRYSSVDRDGTIDNQIVAHEWGHYISHRLIFNSAGLTTNISRGLGEGWADFHAQLLTVNAEDSLIPSNTTFNGIYPQATYSTADNYYGIRRVPYSTDMTKDPLTFRHISDGQALPGGVPIAFGADGSINSEVHNTGEVWATMLWECYAALLRDTLGANPRLTFQQAQDRMKGYIVAAYKMTPANPTLLEARDAVLAAAFATDSTDYAEFWQAFAKRGAGINAVAPDRFSTTNSPGLVESYVQGGAMAITSTSLTDSVLTCDNDGSLDNGETGRLTVTIKNTGSVPLNATTATVASPNPNISFPAGNQIVFPASQPFSTVTGTVPVSLNGAVGIQQLDFMVTATDPGLNPAGSVGASLTVRGNSRSALNASANDDVEANISAWTLITTNSATFTRVMNTTNPINFLWSGPDLGTGVAERSLVSPPLVVGLNPFTIGFNHRYSFETDANGFYDGGVVEISVDNGAHWNDIGTGYNHIVTTGGGNPIEGRMAYTGASTSYPNMISQVINLGTTYSGQTVKVRFRIGEDPLAGGAGWDLDNFVFTGLTNTPFTMAVEDQVCVRRRGGQITSN
jgi:hypothetical protein